MSILAIHRVSGEVVQVENAWLFPAVSYVQAGFSIY